MSERREDLTGAVYQLGAGDIGQREYALLLQGLQGYLRKRFPDLSEVDVDDLSGTAVERFLTAIADGRVEAARNVRGYLFTIAHNTALDQLRRRPHDAVPVDPRTATSWLDLQDDDVARTLDGVLGAAAVRSALEQASNNGDRTAFLVVSHLYNAIERTGETPSHRQVASALGLSHTAVAKALVRFRQYAAGGDR